MLLERETYIGQIENIKSTEAKEKCYLVILHTGNQNKIFNTLTGQNKIHRSYNELIMS